MLRQTAQYAQEYAMLKSPGHLSNEGDQSDAVENGIAHILARENSVRIPRLTYSNHLFSWATGLLVGGPFLLGSPGFAFATNGAVNVTVFVWICFVFVWGSVLTSRISRDTKGDVSPDILATKQLVLRFLVVFSLCNGPWTFCCALVYVSDDDNLLQIVYNIAVAIGVLQGFANYVSFTVNTQCLTSHFFSHDPEKESHDPEKEQENWRKGLFPLDNDTLTDLGIEMSDETGGDENEGYHLHVKSESRLSPVLKKIVSKFQCEIAADNVKLGPTIGVGTSAQVKQGTFGNSEVAVKIYINQQLCHKRSQGADGKTALEKEVSVLLSVRSPNVLRLFGVVHLPEGVGIKRRDP
jgi:hypothetical protein